LNRTDLQQLANERVAEARVLLKAKKWSGAYYLAGYAVELALKACLAKQVRAEEFPEKAVQAWWTHDFEQLVFLAGLKGERDNDVRADPVLSEHWTIVKDWKETSRYQRKTRTQAQALFQAITNSKHGVLTWIKFRW
jgi:HEPN domain-containing protein